MKTVVKGCELDAPERITSTKLRKYMATVSQVYTVYNLKIFKARTTYGRRYCIYQWLFQVINLSDCELQELARHMGHELSVHRQFYRLQEDVTELAKVSKLLLTVEQGDAHLYAGMNLDDITFEGMWLIEFSWIYSSYGNILPRECCNIDDAETKYNSLMVNVYERLVGICTCLCTLLCTVIDWLP